MRVTEEHLNALDDMVTNMEPGPLTNLVRALVQEIRELRNTLDNERQRNLRTENALREKFDLLLAKVRRNED